jgi:SAM-dependent methyltransferase
MDQNPGLKNFFDSGFYEEYWPEADDENSVKVLAEKILSLLGARSGHILDWRGGHGRYALWFARAGLNVTLLDFMRPYLDNARTLFSQNDMPVEIIEADSRETPKNIQADFAVCLSNSVGFMSESEEIKAFRSLGDALRTGAKLLVDCMNLFFLTKHIAEGIQEKQSDDGCIRKSEGYFDFRTSVWHKTFELIKPDGSAEKKQFNQIMYTPQHLSAMLEEAGFITEHIYGDFDGTPIVFDSKKIVLLARK